MTDGTSLEELQKQNEEYLAGWKRALADYDNLKKDLAREREAMRAGLTAMLLQNLIPVIDNFDQAMRHAPEPAPAQLTVWLEGVGHIRTQLEEAVKNFGAESYGALGDTFNPNEFEAIGSRQDETAPADSVLEIIQRGWRVHGRVLRPAKVIINQ